MSYDIQAGSYVDAMSNAKQAQYKEDYAHELAKIITSLCQPTHILEAGVGEATTLSGVINHLTKGVYSYGFDISWSRIAFANTWLRKQNINNTFLCSGDLFNIPFLDNSIDVVYTSHSIEPNGGNEKPILQELYRVAKHYLILLEPAYELSSKKAQQRMASHGYCKQLKEIAQSMNYQVIEHKLYPIIGNALNPTGITIIAKQHKANNNKDHQSEEKEKPMTDPFFCFCLSQIQNAS